MKELVKELLEDKIEKDKMEKEKANKLAEVFTKGHWTHDYPITVKKLDALG